MSADTPAIRAEQALLGAILADEQSRAQARKTLSDAPRAWEEAVRGPGWSRDEQAIAEAKARLARPRSLDTVKGWIHRPHFLRPYHGQVWAAITWLRDHHQDATPEAVRGRLVADRDLRIETAGDGLLLHELMARAPVVSRAPLYAGMVVEASLHRELHTEAVRLEQGTSSLDPAQVLGAQVHARTRLAILRQWWERVPPAVRVQLDRPATAEAMAASPIELRTQAREIAAQLEETRARVAAQRAAGHAPAAADMSLIERLTDLLSRVLALVDGLANASLDARRSPTPTDRAALTPGQSLAGTWPNPYIAADADTLTRTAEPEPEQATSVRAQRALREGQLLGAILADPSQLDYLAISSDMLTDPDARQMYQAALDIHRGAGLVDELTVEWAVQRAGGDLSAVRDEVRAGMTAGTAGQAAVLAADIAAAAARDRSAQAVHALRQTAADPRIPPARMLAHAEAELTDLPEPKIDPRPGPARPGPTPARQQRQPSRRASERQAEPVPEPTAADRQRGRDPHPHRRRTRRRPIERECECELEL